MNRKTYYLSLPAGYRLDEHFDIKKYKNIAELKKVVSDKTKDKYIYLKGRAGVSCTICSHQYNRNLHGFQLPCGCDYCYNCIGEFMWEKKMCATCDDPFDTLVPMMIDATKAHDEKDLSDRIKKLNSFRSVIFKRKKEKSKERKAKKALVLAKATQNDDEDAPIIPSVQNNEEDDESDLSDLDDHMVFI